VAISAPTALNPECQITSIELYGGILAKALPNILRHEASPMLAYRLSLYTRMAQDSQARNKFETYSSVAGGRYPSSMLDYFDRLVVHDARYQKCIHPTMITIDNEELANGYPTGL
jgi:hypothetical protein